MAGKNLLNIIMMKFGIMFIALIIIVIQLNSECLIMVKTFGG